MLDELEIFDCKVSNFFPNVQTQKPQILNFSRFLKLFQHYDSNGPPKCKLQMTK